MNYKVFDQSGDNMVEVPFSNVQTVTDAIAKAQKRGLILRDGDIVTVKLEQQWQYKVGMVIKDFTLVPEPSLAERLGTTKEGA